MKSTGS